MGKGACAYTSLQMLGRCAPQQPGRSARPSTKGLAATRPVLLISKWEGSRYYAWRSNSFRFSDPAHTGAGPLAANPFVAGPHERGRHRSKSPGSAAFHIARWTPKPFPLEPSIELLG